MANGNGIEVSTPWFKIEGNGLVTIMLFMTIVVLGFTAYTSYLVSIEHRAITNGLNDVFIAVMTPPDVKANLPEFLKNKMQEKTTEKTKEKMASQP